VHVDWTTFIGPAVIAAVIAAAVSMIVAVINRATLRAMHKERLDLDRDLADRRANADIALAERKVALDRALEAWKRRTEFAEVVLADFYQAQRIIEEARSPGIMSGEGSSRPKYADETEDEARTLNGYFAAAERLNKFTPRSLWLCGCFSTHIGSETWDSCLMAYNSGKALLAGDYPKRTQFPPALPTLLRQLSRVVGQSFRRSHNERSCSRPTVNSNGSCPDRRRRRACPRALPRILRRQHP
jgi:hypothetical protein